MGLEATLGEEPTAKSRQGQTQQSTAPHECYAGQPTGTSTNSHQGFQKSNKKTLEGVVGGKQEQKLRGLLIIIKTEIENKMAKAVVRLI